MEIGTLANKVSSISVVEAVAQLRKRLTDALQPDLEYQLRSALVDLLQEQGQLEEALQAVQVYENEEYRNRLSEAVRSLALLVLARCYIATDLPKAIALLNQAISECKETGQLAGVAEGYYLLGESYLRIQETSVARDYFQEVLKQRPREARLKVLTYLQLGLVEHREGDSFTARKYFEEAMQAAQACDDTAVVGKLYLTVGKICFERCETEDAKRYLRFSVEYLQDRSSRLLALAYVYYAQVLCRFGEWQEAFQKLDEALLIARQTVSRYEEALALSTLGVVEYRVGKLQDAKRDLQAAATLFEQLGVRLELVDCFRYLALVFGTLRQEEEAFDYAKRALQLTFVERTPAQAAGSYLVLAELHLRRREYKVAEDFLNMVRVILDEQVDLELLGIALRLLGKIKVIQDQITAARSALSKSISHLRTARSDYHLAIAELEMGKLLLRLDEKAQAKESLQRAEVLFARLQLETLRRQAESLLKLPQLKVIEGGYSRVSFDSAVERILDVPPQTELLLRELLTMAYELVQARLGIVFEQSPGAELVPVLTQGEQVRDMAQLCLRLKLQIDGGLLTAPNTVIMKIRTPGMRDKVLYLVANERPEEGQLRQLKTLVRLVEHSLELFSLRERTKQSKAFDFTQTLSSIPGFIVASAAMRTVLEQVCKIRSSKLTVLITGESGTGKELVAKAIHLESERREKPFVPFNCAAVAKEIVESRLFGHRKGAFTGAAYDQLGVIRAAEGGTIFLDEIGELPLEIQPKLLRFLQEGEIHPLGEDRPVRIDVRIVAATNRDLGTLVEQGKFREDLFHRLNVIRIHIPPLRERREEILPLAESFLISFCERLGKRVVLSDAAIEKLIKYDWPGNVRQLKNELERIVAYAENDHVVTPDDLSSEIISGTTGKQLSGKCLLVPTDLELAEAVSFLERQMLIEALKRNQGNISRAAKQLGLTRKGLYMKRARLGV
ncbi:MAG: sigma 54-interacting transcriptional regulator [Acidobacteriota bacterium]|nr:sigma 54-interacting transcriptional regulator [Blastocatellia bacterium]MDW8412558.1 sigma 54-interacting transcriptional regulator [Acidobacteriota bacterium]